jgi:hypothetical protein
LFLAANPSKPQSSFSAGVDNWLNRVRLRPTPARATSVPVQLALQTFEKSSLLQKEDSLPVTALARYPSKRRTARTLSVTARAFAQNEAPSWGEPLGALVSFIEVPPSIEVPLCGTFNFSCFSFSSFQTFEKTNTQAARAALPLVAI